MKEYAEKNINLCLTRIDDYTDKMFKILKDSYEKESKTSKDKPKIQIIDYDFDEEDDKGKEKKDKKKKRQMGDLISKTAIEIYNLYSKKDSINQN